MSKLWPVKLDKIGFFSELSYGRFGLSISERTNLLPENLPPGAWPILVHDCGSNKYLYFEYFLSTRIHKWELNENGVRTAGTDANFDEINSAIVAESTAKWIWLQQKLSGLIDLTARVDTDELDSFSRAEKILIESITDNGEISLDQVLADDRISGNKLSRLDYPGDLYFVPPRVKLADGQETDISVSIVNNLRNNLIALLHIGKELVVDANHLSEASLVNWIVGRAIDFHNTHSVELRYERPQKGESFPPRIIVDFASKLVTEHATHKFNRIRESLAIFTPHILMHFGQSASGDRVRICFDDSGNEGFLSFDRPSGSNTTLIPDLMITRHANRKATCPSITEQEFSDNFFKREMKLFWRGSTTGSPLPTLDALMANHRVRACLNIKADLGESADCKISRVVQMPLHLVDDGVKLLQEYGVFSDEVSELEFKNFQMYVDLPGNAAAWGSYHKYLLGCLVLRPWPSSREIACHEVLIPDKHFLAVSPDLSDLGERVRWALSHQEDAAKIAYRGRQVMANYLDTIDATVVQALHRGANLTPYYLMSPLITSSK